MSNLLKSKFLLGVMVAATILVGALALSFITAQSADAASCSGFTMTLRYGMRNSQVMCLQQMLNEKGYRVDGAGAGSSGHETTYFGNATKTAVKSFQAAMGLSADGVFGPMSRAALMNAGGMSGLPAGCTSTSGYSSTTGQPCNTGGMGLPAGCTSTSGFSATTGQPCNGSGGVPQGSGSVMVSLAMDNPASGTLVAGQSTADLAHFAFTGSGTVNSVTLQRTGVSNNSVFDNVYLYQGSTRISDSASVNSNGVIVFNGLNWMVNGSSTVSVKADVNSSASSQTAGVTLTGYTVGSSAVTANVAGNIMNVVSGSGVLGTVNVGTNTATGTAINAGTTQYTMWSAPVSVGTHNMWLKSLALRYIGSAPNDALANIKLYVDGSVVASTSGPNSLGYLVFDLMSNPFSLTTGSHTFDVRADIVKGSSRTIQLTLQNRADLMVTDSQAMINVSPTSPTSAGFSSNSSATLTISTGSVTATVDPSFTAMTTLTGGGTNTVIARYKLRAYGEDVKTETVRVTPSWSVAPTTTTTCVNGTDCGLNNLALYFNGAQVGSSTNWTGTTASSTKTFQLGSSMIVPANQDSILEVHADIQSPINENYSAGTLVVTLEGGSSENNGQGMNSLDHTIDVPSADVATTGLAVSTGLLAVSANPAYTTQTVNPNMTNVKLGSFVLQNQSSSESVRVTNLKVDLDFTSSDSTNVSNLMTSESSGSGATPINPATGDASTDSVNNFSVNFTLAPGATKTIDVMANLGADATGSIVVGLTPTALGVSSNVNVSPNEATGQTINFSTGTFANAGVIVSSSTAPQYVATGSTGLTDATKATYNFKAASGTATISELKFLVTTTSGRASVSSIKVGNVSAPVVSGVAYLTGLNIAVPNGGAGVNVDAYMTYGPTGANGNTSGDESFVEMTYLKYTIGGATSTTVGGQTLMTSNTKLADVDAASADIAAVNSTASITVDSTAAIQPGMIVGIYVDSDSSLTKDSILSVQSITSSTVFVGRTLKIGTNTATDATYNVVFYSVPQNATYAYATDNCPAMTKSAVVVAVGSTSKTDCMSIVGSKPTLGVTDASTQLTNGLVKVGSVTVMADAKGDVAVNALPLTFTSTGNVTIGTGTDNLTVKNAADQTTITTTNDTLAVSAGGSDDTTVTFTGGYTVTAGSTVTFDVYATAATVTGGAGSNALSMKLGAAASFLWTDTAGNGSAGAETGTLLTTYPTTSSTIND